MERIPLMLNYLFRDMAGRQAPSRHPRLLALRRCEGVDARGGATTVRGHDVEGCSRSEFHSTRCDQPEHFPVLGDQRPAVRIQAQCQCRGVQLPTVDAELLRHELSIMNANYRRVRVARTNKPARPIDGRAACSPSLSGRPEPCTRTPRRCIAAGGGDVRAGGPIGAEGIRAWHVRAIGCAAPTGIECLDNSPPTR